MARLVAWVLVFVAPVGLCASIGSLGWALLHSGDSGEGIGGPLFLLIFVVAFPMALLQIWGFRDYSRRDVGKLALAGCPRWMRRISTLLSVAGVAIFFLAFLSSSLRHPAHGGFPALPLAGMGIAVCAGAFSLG